MQFHALRLPLNVGRRRTNVNPNRGPKIESIEDSIKMLLSRSTN